MYMGKSKTVYFFIGTEAEFIKIFPVIIACKKRGMDTIIISSGQNDISHSRIWEVLDGQKIDLKLSDEADIKKNALGLMKWFLVTKRKGISSISEKYGKTALVGVPIVVHGDTVSTLMGAQIGRKFGMAVCHVEAGLRSHHLLDPFPEEIDRMLTSHIARVHFAPGDVPMANLKKVKGKAVNTRYNTLRDSLSIANRMDISDLKIKDVIEKNVPYFVFVMHRQENLIHTEFFASCVKEIIELSTKRHCVMILHAPTEKALISLGLYDELKLNENISLLPRTDYFDFMKLLEHADYVITDGGSNQEELSYMGKPTLIMRKSTERNEGIGMNARLYGNDVRAIINMENAYRSMQRRDVLLDEDEIKPSDIIMDTIAGMK